MQTQIETNAANSSPKNRFQKDG